MRILENPEALAIVLGIAWAVLSAIVAATPTRADDRFLRRLTNRLSFLKPCNVGEGLSLPGRLERPKPSEEKTPPDQPET